MLREYHNSIKYYKGYHYTKTEIFNKIISTHKIRFTYAQDFADKTEGKVILDILKKVLKQKKSDLSKEVYNFLNSIKNIESIGAYEYKEGFYSAEERKVFIACFSIAKDCDNIWNRYIKTKDKKGFNLGINLDQYENVSNFRIEKIVYDKQEQEKIMEDIICKYQKDGKCSAFLKNRLQSLQYTFKKEEYSWEKEVRVLRYVYKSEYGIIKKDEENREYIEEDFFPQDIEIKTSPNNKMTQEELNGLVKELEKNSYSRFSINGQQFKGEN